MQEILLLCSIVLLAIPAAHFVSDSTYDLSLVYFSSSDEILTEPIYNSFPSQVSVWEPKRAK